MRGGAKNLDWRRRSGSGSSQNLAGIVRTDAPAATPAATSSWRRQAKWTALGMAAACAVVATISPTSGPFVRAGVGYMVLSDAAALEKLAVPRGAHKEWNRRVFKNQKSESAAHISRAARARDTQELNEIDTMDAKTTTDADVYREALTRCVWKDEGPATAGGLTRFNLAKLEGDVGWERLDGSALTSRRCTVPDTDGGGKWVIRRVGPMTYTGGGDFQMMGWSNPGDLVDDALLTGWSARPVHEDGTPFGFPPLHVHHAHLNPSMAVLDPEDGVDGQFIEVSQRGVLWSSLNWLSAKILAEALGLRHGDSLDGVTRATGRVAQLHGDNLCTDEHGGTDCYIHLHNKTEGLKIKPSLAVDLVFEDVRPAGSPDLTGVYAEVMLRTAPLDQHHVELGFDRLGLLPHFPLDRFITYRAPTDSRSISVGMGAFKNSGQVVEHKLHSHRRATNATWLVIGATPAELGWAAWRWPEDLGAGALLPNAMKVDSFNPTKERVRAHIKRMRHAGHNITLCHDDGAQTSHEHEGPQDGTDGWYDRYSELLCPHWDMEAGTAWTIVSFNQPPKQNPTHRTWWPQHTTVYLKWRALPGEKPVNNVAFEEATERMRSKFPAIQYAAIDTQ